MAKKTRIKRFMDIASDAGISAKMALDAKSFATKMFNASKKKSDKFLWNDITLLIGTLQK